MNAQPDLPVRRDLLVPLTKPTDAPAGDRMPYFLVSGLGGHVLPFQRMAQEIADRRPGTGILFPAILDAADQFDRVEPLAARMLEALTVHRPSGPYLLVGYSFGGLIVHEMARQLRARGEIVGIVTIDAISTFLMPRRARPVRLAFRLWRRLRRSAARPTQPGRGTGTSALARTIEELRRCSLAARSAYVPPMIDAPSIVIRRDRMDDTRWLLQMRDDLGWSQAAPVIDVIRTRGGHLDLFKGDNATALAENLADALDRLEAYMPLPDIAEGDTT